MKACLSGIHVFRTLWLPSWSQAGSTHTLAFKHTRYLFAPLFSKSNVLALNHQPGRKSCLSYALGIPLSTHRWAPAEPLRALEEGHVGLVKAGCTSSFPAEHHLEDPSQGFRDGLATLRGHTTQGTHPRHCGYAGHSSGASYGPKLKPPQPPPHPSSCPRSSLLPLYLWWKMCENTFSLLMPSLN